MRIDIVCCLSMLCNLRCRYCDVYPMLGDSRRMSLEQVQRIFVNVHEHFSRLDKPIHINFQWYGGEPLLIPPESYRKIFDLQRLVFNGSGHRITNSVQSNFILIDEERIALLRDHFDVVGASLDLFTDLRVNKAGVCQEFQAVTNLENVLSAGVEVSGITVLTRPNLPHISEIYEFYRDRRMSFRLLPLERGLYAAGQDFEVTPGETLEALCRLADVWLSDSNPVPVEPLSRYLFLVRHMLGHPGNRVGLYDREEWMSILLISTDGTVRGYGDRFQETLGNIFDLSLSEILFGPRFHSAAQTARNRMQRTCTGCSYLGRACSGDPIAESQQDLVEFDDFGNVRCVVARGVISYLEDRLQRNRGWVDGSIGAAVCEPYSSLTEV